MNPVSRPAALALAVALAAGVATLGGCHKAADKEVSTMPDVKPGIVVSAPRIVLPAVPGRPAVLYFTVANTGTALSRIVRIEVDGASKVEMHQTTGGTMTPMDIVRIEPTQVVNFEPGGKHAMVFGLKPDVVPGQEVGVTLHFFDGRVYNLEARTLATGNGSLVPSMARPGEGDMPGMDKGADAMSSEHQH